MAEVHSTDQWRQIPTHPDYEITPSGQIRRIGSTRILKPALSIDGYPHLSLGSQSKNNRVHRLVAVTFLGPCPVGYQVNHKDGDRANPNLDNLEYVTASGNSKHAVGRIGEWGSVRTIAGAHRAKTQCPQGHPYDEANTFILKSGGRSCRRCMYDRSMRWAKRNPGKSKEYQRRYNAKRP